MPAEPATALTPEREVVELFDEMRDRLLRYLLCLGLSAHDGEEILQETFLQLFQHLRKGKSRQNLRGWLFRVARNLALRQRTITRSRQQSQIQFDENLFSGSGAGGMTPEDELHRRRRQSRLLAVVRALPEKDRSCLYLRAEGLRYREIAGILGIGLGSVAASLSRSMERLKRADS